MLEKYYDPYRTTGSNDIQCYSIIAKMCSKCET